VKTTIYPINFAEFVFYITIHSH